MKFRSIKLGLLLSFFVTTNAFAVSSQNFAVDLDSLNDSGQVSQSANFKLNDTITGFVSGDTVNSSSFILESGLVNLELYCGNNILEFGEQCDDGNRISNDGCSSICVSDTAASSGSSGAPSTSPANGGGYRNLCSNGVLDAGYGEQCDDGNALNGDGCSAVCKLELATEDPTEPTRPTEPTKPAEPTRPDKPIVTDDDRPVEGPEFTKLPDLINSSDFVIVPRHSFREPLLHGAADDFEILPDDSTPIADQCLAFVAKINDLVYQNRCLIGLVIIFLVLFLISLAFNFRQKRIIKQLKKHLKRKIK